METHVPIDTAGSSESRELQDFEDYNRTEVPLLVEIRLQAELDTSMASVAENLRPRLVDIVRECQSIAAENFRASRVSRPNTACSSITEDNQAGRSGRYERQLISNTTQPTAGYYRELPHEESHADDLFPEPVLNCNEEDRHQSLTNDSGYEECHPSCECSCHVDESQLEQAGCKHCVGDHPDFTDLDWQNLLNFQEY